MGFFIFTLCLVSSYHELGIGDSGIAVKVLYQVSNVFMHPMEEMIFEMLLHLLISNPPGVLQPDLIKGPF